MGHRGTTEGLIGLVNLLGDIAHSLAAAVWIGVLGHPGTGNSQLI